MAAEALLGSEHHVAGAKKVATEGMDWRPQDTNHDGVIDGRDIPFEPGSVDAKVAWQKIEALGHSPDAIVKAREMGYKDATGIYGGKPLVPGVGGGQGDFYQLVDKLVYYHGYSPEVAMKIAAKVRWNLEGA